ncbi:MAG: COG1361 S-layer family protein [Candidatus Aenigmarchaeota archaeon]|nr:COG1361 S-layer family protein [Candidatus Aenigmarchaeota archaeon]
MMKKVYLSAIMLLLVMVPCIVSAQVSSDLETVLIGQTPYPAEPGGNVDIEVSLQNNGFAEATDVAVEIMPSSPFSLVKGDKIKTYPAIGARSTVKLTYTLLVDDSALAGDYDLEFRLYNPLTPEIFQKKEIELTVLGETKIIVDRVETTPSVIEPGGSAAIHVTLKNVGTGDARQFEAVMESSAEELVPVLSGGLAYVGDFNAGEEKTLDFMFSIDPDADQDTYLTSLTLSYKDDNNQANTETFSLGIPVSGNIRFEVVTIEPSFSRGTINIEVANKGTGDAQSVEAKLVVNGEAVGVDYLSQLKATKKTTFSFPLVLSGNAELVITYTEPGLVQKTINKDLGPLNIAAPGGDSSSTIIFIIAIAVIGYFVWRTYFRKKKRQ